MLVGLPIILLLLFVYVFGGTLGAGLARRRPAAAGRLRQLRAPGIILLTVTAAAASGYGHLGVRWT